MAIVVASVRALEVNGALVSAFCKQSIEFTVAGAPDGHYCEIYTTGGYKFRCTNTTGTTWVIDMNMLSALLGLPPTSITITGLVNAKDFQIVVKDSAGSIIDSTTYSDVGTLLCFGYPSRGVANGMATVIADGTSMPIYHNGRFCKYDSGTGAYVITTSTALEIYKAPKSGTAEIAWIDRDGKWSFWNFRYLSKEMDNKQSNPVPYYALTNVLQIMDSYDIERESTIRLNFDTVAVDSIHYAQLCEISKSPRVIYGGLIYRVVNSNKTAADCQKNLKFNLTLETQENAVSY
jgi:hypothetical protein